MNYSRADRVGELIQQTVSEIIAKQIKDPRLAMITITHVKMTRDLKLARIYFTAHGGTDRVAEALKGFHSALGYVKRSLGRELQLRYMPAIEFFYDDTLDRASRIESIIESLKDT